MVGVGRVAAAAAAVAAAVPAGRAEGGIAVAAAATEQVTPLTDCCHTLHICNTALHCHNSITAAPRVTRPLRLDAHNIVPCRCLSKSHLGSKRIRRHAFALRHQCHLTRSHSQHRQSYIQVRPPNSTIGRHNIHTDVHGPGGVSGKRIKVNRSSRVKDTSGRSCNLARSAQPSVDRERYRQVVATVARRRTGA